MDSNMKSVLRHYLSKCGDGRGLEKFLRRNSFSSDCSTPIECSTPITTKARNKTKSLESLTDKKDRESVRNLSENSKSHVKKEGDKLEVKKAEKSMESAKVIVKHTGEKLDKKKSQFNYESIIEITLPSAPTLPPNPPQVLDKSQNEEEPIKPILCTPAKPKIPSHNNANMSPSSVHESCVSNKQNPLEWDSFLPGFDSSATPQNFQLCNPMELGDKELDALKTYFQRQGLQLPNENLVVVIKNKQESTMERQFIEIKRNKEKWQNIYEKYKEKYHQRSFLPDAQSTPNIQEPTSKMTEKSSQTSLVKNTVKSTQVEVGRISKQCQVTVNKGTLSSQHSQETQDIYNNQSEIAESFEFIHGSLKKPCSESDEESKTVEISRKSSTKNSESSVRNEDISNFDDSLKVAIALLNSLLESRNMKPELKRNLAGKVIQKIVQIQTSRSIQTSTLSSGIYPLSNSSRAVSEAEKSVKEASVKSIAGSEEKSKDSSKSSKSSRKSREDVLKDCFKPMTQSEVDYQHSIEDDPTKGSSKAPKSQLMDYVKREKQSHLKWIEKEIEHLRNLRDLLKRNETPSIDENNPLYANLASLRIDKVVEPVIEVAEKDLMPPPLSIPSTNLWDSHANTKKSSKSRSKLGTPEPPVEESLASFIENKNKKFIEKYGKSRKEHEEQNLYTRPYSAKKFPEGHRVIKARKSLATKDVQTSTSLASSSVFESSDSMSVPVNSNSKTSTTQYQSENFDRSEKKSSKSKQKIAETQTTDSICRTNPIFETRKKSSDEKKFGTGSTTVTQRIQRMTNNKQQQTHPPSIRYTLTFDKKSRANIREYLSLPQKGNSEYAAISKSSKEIYNQISCSATLDNRRSSEDKENYDADEIIDDNDEIGLQRCLNQNRPDIFMRVEERKRCIAELKKLRALRNEHRKKLLLLTSDKSLEVKLLASLPEPPLKTTRMFSTKALKLQTQKKVQNLTEVKQKKKEENNKNLKRKNRLMTEIFNKNLQRNVLRGNLNLSNTVNLLQKL